MESTSQLRMFYSERLARRSWLDEEEGRRRLTSQVISRPYGARMRLVTMVYSFSL